MSSASFEDLLAACAVAVAVPGREGSGFFVAPGLVVTAAHVVGASATCSVTWDEGSFPANVLVRLPDATVGSGPYPAPDVAVLEVVDAPTHPWIELDLTVPRFGENADRLFAVGYTRRYSADRLTKTPLSYLGEGMLHVDGADLVQLRDGLVVPRMSGAPVLNLRTGRVVGHIKRTSDERVPTGGWVVHCRSWLEQVGAVQQRHQAACRENSRWRDARARLLEPHLRRATQAPPSSDFPPSAALAPEYGLVAFSGREEDLAELHAWCDDPAGFGVRLLAGPGGIGKSRLAAELCAQRERSGWIAGIVDVSAPPTILADVRAMGDPALVVIDYAESCRDLGELLRRAVAVEADAPLRVLLLARGTAEWWDDLCEAPERRVRDAALRYPPKTLGTQLGDNSAVGDTVVHAARCFAVALSRPCPNPPPLPPEANQWPVLSLHAWALLSVLSVGESSPAMPPSAVSPLWRELLGHEARYWRATARRAELTALDTTTLRRSVGLLALLGTTAEQQIVQALTRVPELSDADGLLRHRIARWLRDVYPGQPPDWLGRLSPDVLAEHHVVEQLSSAPEFARRALTGLPPDQSTHALTVLARAMGHRSDAADVITAALRADLPRLALPAVEAARRTGPALGRLLATAVASSASPLLIDALARITPPRSEALRDLRIVLLRRQLAAASSGSLEQVDLMVDLGRLLVMAGPLDEARGLALAALRTLDRRHGVGTRIRRARALSLLGEALQALGHTPEALKANADAVALFRKEFASDLTARPVELANALIMRSHILLDAEEPADAEAKAREAIAVLEARPASTPGWRLTLARAQAALAMALWRTDRPEHDLESFHSAVDSLRALTIQDSDQHLSELGVALDQLGVRLSELRQPEEAIVHTREAVRIFRRLAGDNPVLYSTFLAVSLHNLAVRLCEHDRNEEALGPGQEAVDLRRRLAHDGASVARLTRSLVNLGGYHEHLGHREESLAAIGEAVGLCRQLATDHGDRFARDFGASLLALASVLAEDAPDEALPTAEEAITVLRASENSHPGRARWMLARALRRLAAIHIARGDVPAALAANEEAAELLLELADDAPQAYAAAAVEALRATVVLHGVRDNQDLGAAEAEQSSARTIAALRRCEAIAPGCATAGLAEALEADARRALELGQHDEALNRAIEAVALARGAVAAAGAVNAELLARCLNAMAQALLPAGRRLEAIDALAECVTVSLEADHPDARVPKEIGGILRFLGQAELSIGRHASAAGHLSAAIGRIAAEMDAERAGADQMRSALFEASDYCLQATTRTGEARAAVACAVLALATSEGAEAERVAACLRNLCLVADQAPAAATAAWREIVGEDLPSLPAGIAARSTAASARTPAEAVASTEREQFLANVARPFGPAAARAVADGERVLDELRAELGSGEQPSARLMRLLVQAERLGLRRGFRRMDLMRLARPRRGPRRTLDAALARALTAGTLREVDGRVHLTPYLAAAVAWCDDLAAPEPGIGKRVVMLADPEDLLRLAGNAEEAGADDIADAALTRGVELGSGDAMYNFAFRLNQQGKLDQAWPLYERAASAGVAAGKVTVGALLASRGEFDGAERWLREAAADGHARGMASLAGLLLMTGRQPEARHWAALAADGGDRIGMHLLGRIGLDAGDPDGEQWLSAAADRGSVGAMRDLGEHLLTTDSRLGEDWLRKAAAAGDAIAGARLMEHLEQQGRAVDDDLVTWLAESRDAAFSPDGAELLVPDDFRPHAHKMRVISMLEMGRRAVDRGDLDVAQAWLERALRAQIPAEAGAMADYLLEQLEEKSDLTAMWVAMAESGDILAMYNAGLCFWRKEQLDEAEHWWRRGAEAGDVECETKVGVVNFQTGNLQEAERWFQRAAEQNEPVALFNLGVLAHQRGANDEAAQWFARAGDAGHEGAAEVLQKLQKVAADGA